MTDQPQVKKWTRESIHPTYEGATEALVKLGMEREGSKPPLAKVRLQARGYVIKTWRGEMQAAPPPKKKEEAPADSLSL